MLLADLFESFLIDLDGVIYIGDKPTHRAPDTIKKLEKSGKKIIYLTNDPRKSSSQYAVKLSSLGIKTSPERVITSASALSKHIQNKFNIASKSAFVIGSENLKEEIKSIGLKLISKKSSDYPDFVIVGGNNCVDYNDLKKATLSIRSGAEFFATNNDPYYPTPEGLVPATGALVAAIETASSRKATVVGKPRAIMFNIAKKMLGDSNRCAVIGDRLDTDISGGKRAGLSTILSLTGSTNTDELSKSKIKPDYVIKDLTYLLKDLNLSLYLRSD